MARGFSEAAGEDSRYAGQAHRHGEGRRAAASRAAQSGDPDLTRKAGENDQLFGSVTSGDLAEGLKAQGFEIDKRRIQLDEPIKIIGEKAVSVKLVHGVTAEFKVVVGKEA